eukprot:TRINITY_DN2937_c0_g1_i1.p1 TRINITY_DN2937_c0_g1~~TRINITY_DN2937_c0_g1_i1.p1  ORF type:complete len:1250 (+),score=270.23 TRINITY_DN2937_c0_g1_i1:541-4290(+)
MVKIRNTMCRLGTALSHILLVILFIEGFVMTSCQDFTQPDGYSNSLPLAKESWTPFGDGFVLDSMNSRNPGVGSFMVSSQEEFAVAGAFVQVDLNQVDARNLVIGGYSKADGVTGDEDVDYSIYVDVAYMDGSYDYAISAPFSVGWHDWEYRCGLVPIDRPAQSIWFYAVLRNNHTGTVWFDSLFLYELPLNEPTANTVASVETFDFSTIITPSFETAAVSDNVNLLPATSVGWKSVGTGVITDLTSQRVPGRASLRMASQNANMAAGATFTVTLAQTTAKSLLLSGWSKALYVTAAADTNYALTADLVFMDGTVARGFNTPFSIASHNWEYKCGRIVVTKPVRTVTVYMRFRSPHTGTVWFDGVELKQLSSGTISAGMEVASEEDLAAQQPMGIGLPTVGPLPGVVTSPGYTPSLTNPAWAAYGVGYTIDPYTNRVNGVPTMQLASSHAATTQGAVIQVTVGQSIAKPLVLSGWSKASSVSGVNDVNYALVADVQFTDGSISYGYAVPFDVGTHEFQYKCGQIVPTKPISKAWIYVVFRLTHKGMAWFGDVQLRDLSSVTGQSEYTVLDVSGADIGTGPGTLATTSLIPAGLVGWSAYLSGFTSDSTTVRVAGRPTMMMTTTVPSTAFGAKYSLVIPSPTVRDWTLSAWSKARIVTGASDRYYGVSADLKFVDGSTVLGQYIAFSPGTHDWEYKSLIMSFPKAIASMSVYALFQKTHTGQVWFDGIAVEATGAVPTPSPTPSVSPSPITPSPSPVPSTSPVTPAPSPSVAPSPYPLPTNPASWQVYGLGYTLDWNSVRAAGVPSLAVSATVMNTRAGAWYQLDLNQVTASAVVIGGWSKAAGVTGVVNMDYSLAVDVAHSDGTFSYGYNAPFDIGTHDWQYKCGIIAPGKPIRSLWVYLLFRNTHTGTVWFDSVTLTTQGSGPLVIPTPTPSGSPSPTPIVSPLPSVSPVPTMAPGANLITTPPTSSGTGFIIDPAVVRIPGVSTSSYRMSSVNQNLAAGMSWVLTLAQTTARDVQISGWGRAQYVTGAADNNFAIVASVAFMDGSSTTLALPLGFGTFDWKYVSGTVPATKPINTIVVTCWLRSPHTGTAWFSDIAVQPMTPQISRMLTPLELRDLAEDQLNSEIGATAPSENVVRPIVISLATAMGAAMMLIAAVLYMRRRRRQQQMTSSPMMASEEDQVVHLDEHAGGATYANVRVSPMAKPKSPRAVTGLQSPTRQSPRLAQLPPNSPGSVMTPRSPRHGNMFD